MRRFIISVVAAIFFAETVSAFAPIAATRTVISLHAAVELKPEPEGGEDVPIVKTMDGSRMKKMGVADGVKNEDGVVYKFWLTATAQGALIKELNTQVLKDASKKANFPGFRKVGPSKQCI